MKIKTQPNEKRCHRMKETHILSLAPCYPMSGNPLLGSEIEISYEPDKRILEVSSLRTYVDSYRGGKGDIRSMEGMIQAIAQVCAYVIAQLNIAPEQKMILECSALVKRAR